MEPGALRSRAAEPAALPDEPLPGWPLDARLSPPAPRRGTIDRPLLWRRLGVALESPAVILSAPAGYGKSTALAQLAGRDQRALAWLTLEPADDDAANLVTGLAAALDRTEPIDDPLRNALRAGPATLVPRALPRLARALLRRDDPVLLVLDGTEHLRSRVSQDSLRVLIDHVPPGSNLVMASRAPLPPRTAKLRADGRLAVLDANDLRATGGEIGQILDALGLDVAPPVVENVERRTEGWPVAVYLAALALREHPEAPPDTKLHGGEPTLRAYFDDEVIALAGRADAAFLRDASILARLSPEACDAVLERDDSASVLERLAQGNVFVTRSGGLEREYLLHPLFAEALGSVLERDEPELLGALHRRACDWHAEREQPGDAIRHALAAGDTERAVAIVWSAMPAYESSGRAGTLRNWLGMFGEGGLEAHPALALTDTWIRIDMGDGYGAREILAVAERGGSGEALPDGSPVDAFVAMTRSALGGDGIGEVVRLAERAAELDPEPRIWTGLNLYLAGAGRHLQGDRDGAEGRLEEAARLTGTLLPTANTLVLSQLALLALEREDLDRADDLTRLARTRIDRHGLSEYAILACCFAVSALVAVRRGRLGAAADDARHAAGLLALHHYVAPWLAAQTAIVLARAQLRLGDLAAARALASDGERELHGTAGAVVLRELLDDVWERVQSADVELPLGPSSLTTAERRVLHYLPTHLTFKEIGAHLHVAQTTVKTQALAVYRKLDVNSRSDAVRRGQELGLLDP